MHVDWAALAEIALVSAAAALALVLLVAFAVVGSSARSGRWVPGPGAERGPLTRPGVGTAIAVGCALAAGLVVGFGLHLIVAG
jgi:hypothetical protein